MINTSKYQKNNIYTKKYICLHLMNENKITSVFISETEDGKFPIGIVHLHDCLRLGNG